MRLEKIQTIVNIRSSLSFRGVSAEESASGIYLLQPKDIVVGSPISESKGLVHVSFKKSIPTNLEIGDIVLIPRCTDSGNFKAAVYTGSEGKIIASPSLYVLKPVSDIASSEYVASFLNSAIGQAMLRKIATGATIKYLPVSLLKDMLIPILPKEEQKAFVELERNIRQQINLLDKQKNILSNLLVGASQSLLSPNV